MPANLTPDYLAAEGRFRAAETNEEKLAALEEMYATIPKHKGTEKLQADIKRRISRLRDKEKQAKKGKRFDEFHVVRQGAGQVALLGPPNSGKSMLLSRLTAAVPDVADYPFTTRSPMPGMMEYQDVSIQLVDLPPVAEGYTERAVISLARNADSVLLVLDAADNALLDHIEDVREELSKSRMAIVGKDVPESDQAAGVVTSRTLVVANKMDLPGADDNLSVLRELYGAEFAVFPTSAATGHGLEDLRRGVYESLDIIRVYTKIPGRPPDREKPFTLKKGSTLVDFAAAVHKDFVQGLRLARAWGKNMLDGAQIGRDHVLEDGDVVELHT